MRTWVLAHNDCAPIPIALPTMDKRIRKKLDKCRQQLQTMRQQLAGAKKQPDEPGEVERLEAQIAAIHAEIAKLKQNA